MEIINTIGRRKTAVARIYMQPGDGKITINKRDLEQYFTVETLQNVVKKPLELVNYADKSAPCHFACHHRVGTRTPPGVENEWFFAQRPQNGRTEKARTEKSP